MFEVDAFVTRCRAALAEPKPMLAVKEILERTVADPDALASALRAEPGAVVLHRSADLTVLSIVVPAGSRASVPHDHRMWAVVGVYQGQEDNQFFRRDGSGLVETGERSLRVSDTLAMGDETIHAIRNPLDRHALAAIHVYGGDLLGAARSMFPPPDHREEPFDDKAVIGPGGYRS